ncbi:glycosyltransferase family 4 protein [Glutamicibacter mysorens]|uniref:glycosyltransferase family 4 protein n=1 Tax=Glutamicibacter mysorens TaxID=257984 RepID=UPI0020C66340|nr:glycosyltransferase family 4 protein [Glutamicibacter mysorens]UTM47553.1 glycosyltransferase family 4 protein [Glutamicibacter mysorens]
MNLKVIPNAINTGKLILSNVADDPTYFALQVARRFKSKPVLGALINTLGSANSSIRLRALSAMLRDDSSELHSACRDWESSGGNPSQAVFLANLCIASNEWKLAGELLSRSAPSNAHVRANARLLWSLGRMTDAIKLLRDIHSRRQLSHYESELATFKGIEPQVASLRVPDKSNRAARSVLYVATNSLPHTGSGYAQRTHSILTSIKDAGWRVTGLTRVNYPLNIGKLSASDTDVVSGIEYQRCLPFPAKHDLTGRIQQQAEDLLARVIREKPSVLHTTTDFSNALAVKSVAEATGTPWVYEVRGQLADTWLSTRPNSSKDSERYRLFVEREAFVAQHADHVFTLGDAMKRNLVDAGVDEHKISILPNGIGEKFVEEPVPRVQAREQLMLDPEAFYVGTVSSLVSYEGLSTVVRAVAELANQHESLRLLVVGDGIDRENLVSLAQELGITGRCIFPGRIPREQAHLYHAALDAFVVPRIDSAVTRSVTPLKPVEALASNVPVLASNLPALRELIADGENGHLITPGVVSEWAECIERMMLNPDKAERMGKSGREFVLANRTWEQNARSIVEVYERVISKAP